MRQQQHQQFLVCHCPRLTLVSELAGLTSWVGNQAWKRSLLSVGKSPLHLKYTLGRALWSYLVSGTYFRLYTGRSENPPHSTLKSLSGHRP